MNLPDLAALVRDAQPDDLPAIVGKLAEAQALALTRLTTTSPKEVQEVEPDRLLTPEQAAEVAVVPVERIYSWARKATWARRPSTRCLRIVERGFRKWLASRT
jgi:hypothetical protein